MSARESLDFTEFSHIIPSLRFTKVAGAAPATPIAVPGAEPGDVLLGVTQDGGVLDLLSEATLVDGELTLSTTDMTGEFLLVVYADRDGVL